VRQKPHVRGRALSPGTGFLDTETGPQKSPPETTCARRDQEAPESGPQMQAQTAYLNLTGKYPVQRDWVVETVDIELAAHHAVIETSLH
jgi:hypothetical protein